MNFCHYFKNLVTNTQITQIIVENCQEFIENNMPKIDEILYKLSIFFQNEQCPPETFLISLSSLYIKEAFLLAISQRFFPEIQQYFCEKYANEIEQIITEVINNMIDNISKYKNPQSAILSFLKTKEGIIHCFMTGYLIAYSLNRYHLQTLLLTSAL